MSYIKFEFFQKKRLINIDHGFGIQWQLAKGLLKKLPTQWWSHLVGV